MKQSVLIIDVGVCFVGLVGAVMIGSSSITLCGSSSIFSCFGTYMLVSTICSVSNLFVLLVGEFSVPLILFDRLVGVFFPLLLTFASALFLFVLGLSYQYAVYSPFVVGNCPPSEVALFSSAEVGGGGWAWLGISRMMPRILVCICLRCTYGLDG